MGARRSSPTGGIHTAVALNHAHHICATHTMPFQALYDLPAPAKLNLFLHIVGRRPDGYHLLESVFTLIDWADTLHLERRRDGQINRHDLTEALPADDLCLRAARALQRASGTELGVDIHIQKVLPSGAGMGGGSSDAATVLLGLNRLWELNWDRQRLMQLAQTLGADVPFFVFGQTALVQGIGEQMRALAVAPATYAVVKPRASLPTAEIFSSPLLKRDTKSAIVMGSLGSEALHALNDSQSLWGRNDLQAPALARCEEVAIALSRLEATFGNSRMTGSGSAVFSKVDTRRWSEATFQAVCLPEWTVKWCRDVPEHPLRAWAHG